MENIISLKDPRVPTRESFTTLETLEHLPVEMKKTNEHRIYKRRHLRNKSRIRMTVK